tara:strand:- start:128 stop:580 length:453 start_codon:yes stop_codon:yes gene_type:complete
MTASTTDLCTQTARTAESNNIGESLPVPITLSAQFPSNLRTRSLLTQVDIPCLCRINYSDFEMEFRLPLQPTLGRVTGHEMKEIEVRAPAGAGGEFIYYNEGLVSLSPLKPGSYSIVKLALFDEFVGWCPIILNSEYAAPRNFDDVDDFV